MRVQPFGVPLCPQAEVACGANVHEWLGYIDGLQKASREEVGFLPLSWLEEKINASLVAVVLVNGEPGGYIVFGSPRSGVPFRWFQVAIDYDLRRRKYGALLVDYVEAIGRAANAQDIHFTCAADIDANQFWQEQGYACTGNILGGVRRNRWLNTYRKALWPELLSVTAEPVLHETRAVPWKPASGYGLSPWHRLDQQTLEVLRK